MISKFLFKYSFDEIQPKGAWWVVMLHPKIPGHAIQLLPSGVVSAPATESQKQAGPMMVGSIRDYFTLVRLNNTYQWVSYFFLLRVHPHLRRQRVAEKLTRSLVSLKSSKKKIIEANVLLIGIYSVNVAR